MSYNKLPVPFSIARHRPRRAGVALQHSPALVQDEVDVPVLLLVRDQVHVAEKHAAAAHARDAVQEGVWVLAGEHAALVLGVEVS